MLGQSPQNKHIFLLIRRELSASDQLKAAEKLQHRGYIYDVGVISRAIVVDVAIRGDGGGGDNVCCCWPLI